MIKAPVAGEAAGVVFENKDKYEFRRMKKGFLALLWLAAWVPLSMTIAVAQPSVYSGVYADGEGGLTTLSDWQAVSNFVSNAQKGLSIVNNFDSWTDTSGSTNGTQTFPTSELNNIRSSNSIPMFTWQPQNSTEGVTQSFTLASIIAGDYDSYITTWATAAKAWGYPFFLRFAHEMNGNWYPWAASVNGNTASQYIQAWQHVHNIFVSVGATNATWVWCVNVISGLPTPINQIYPGDNYVDWIALDGYNRVTNGWQDFSAIAATTVTQLTNVAPGKPIMVAETGCTQTNYPAETKAQWFLAALTNYVPSTPRIKAWVYFNSTNSSGEDWRITSPSNAVTGYQHGIGLSYYDTNEYGAISNSPIQPLLNDDTTTDMMPPFVSIVSPATDQVTNGTVVNVLALASDKYGVSNVVFAVNGVAQQTNNSPPYQFPWTVPFQGVMTDTVTATAYDSGGNSAVSTIQVVSQGPGNILQAVTEGSGTNWNNASWGGPPAEAPTSGNNYETPNGFVVRTPASDGPVAAFAGNSLQIDSGGILDLKNGGETNGNNAATVNLLLNGGEMNFHGGYAPDGPAVAGTIQVTSNSVITTDQTGANAADILVQSPISGSGNLTVNMNSTTNSVILIGNNSAYSGNWTNASTFGYIKILSGATNALGSGGVILVNPNASLTINSTNNLVINSSISGVGSVVQENTNTVTLNGSNTFTGSLQISNGVLQLGASASIGGTPTIQLSSGAVLNVAAVSGGFAVGSSQTLAGIGNVLGNVTINGTVSPGPLGTLNFANSLALSGTAVMELNRTNAQNADLISATTLAFGGTLMVTNLGGALQAGDSFQLFSGAISGAFAATNLPALSPTNLFWDTSELNSQGILDVAMATAASPMILSPTWNGTNLTLQVNSQMGFNYVLETTPQLAPANWTAIQTNAGGGLLTFTIPINANTQQFFRISVQ
jgi:autotransporter-associated beta strand protein